MEKTDKGTEITARTSLGVTCCLAVVTIGFVGNTKPKVSYATALDVYIILCFVLVFSALNEYAFIHFIDLYVRRVKYKDQDRVLHIQEMTHTMVFPVLGRCPVQAQVNMRIFTSIDFKKRKIHFCSRIKLYHSSIV